MNPNVRFCVVRIPIVASVLSVCAGYTGHLAVTASRQRSSSQGSSSSALMSQTINSWALAMPAGDSIAVACRLECSSEGHLLGQQTRSTAVVAAGADEAVWQGCGSAATLSERSPWRSGERVVA